MSGPPQIRDASATYIVGAATADTILAGPGLVGRALPWVPRPAPSVYGQLVHVDSLNGFGADRMERAFAERRSRAAVIVPWGYDPTCRTDFWMRSARWVTPDSSGLFNLRLRPESLWVAGRPTLDAEYADVRSYVGLRPDQLSALAGTVLASDRALTPAEVFEIYIRLPMRFAPPDTAAIARLREWVRANPAFLARYPGNFILQRWAPAAPR